MNKETLHFTVGPLIGEHLLEIAQTNISNGNVEYGANVYKMAFAGFTDELTLKVLKNQLVVITDEDGEGIHLTDWENEIKANAHNIFDWEYIMKERHNNLKGLLQNLLDTEEKFHNYYNGDIRNYSMLDMMKRYYTDEEMKVMSGKANIAARICGHPECKICDKGSSNPWSVWNRLEGRCESYLADIEDYGESDMPYPPAKWELILYLTVRYNKLIRMIQKEYMNYENTYLFLVEHDFIKKPLYNETFIENVISVLVKFCDTGEGYYHPLCNTGLYEYKENLYEDILKTKYGKEYCQNGIIKNDIMDGYDAGWLSPDGEFYGANGETSAMIHMNLADQIFDGNSVYANRMAKDGISKFGGIDSPDYWLEKHGWIKIHHDDCYGSFIGHRNEKPTPDYPYAYVPTAIQVKMICDYADKFYGGKFYTEANVMGRDFHPEANKTYAVRQMDDIMLHEIFGR